MDRTYTGAIITHEARPRSKRLQVAGLATLGSVGGIDLSSYLTKTEAATLYHPYGGSLYLPLRSSGLSFGEVETADESADLEVIVRNNVRYLHTRLPFYSDSSVSSGGISTDGSASGAGSSVAWGTSSNAGHELLTVDDYQARDISLYGHGHGADKIAIGSGLYLSDIVPSQASASNQLADKEFVNSSVATNTATFRGTFETVAALNAITGMRTNDYAFIYDTDGDYYRYKYNGSSWALEYKLNNSGFTAAQWATINSGITSGSFDGFLPLSAGSAKPLTGPLFSQDIVPNSTAGAYSLGNSAYPWANLWLKSPAGIYSGGAQCLYLSDNRVNINVGGDQIISAYSDTNNGTTSKSALLINRNGSTITRSVNYYAATTHAFSVNNSTLNDQTWDVVMAISTDGAGGDRLVRVSADFSPMDTGRSLGSSSISWRRLYSEDAHVKSFITWKRQGTQYTDDSGSSQTANGGFNFYTIDSSGTWANAFTVLPSGNISYVDLTIDSSKTLKLGNGTLSWDNDNNAWKLTGNFYATGFVASGGTGSVSGSGAGSSSVVWGTSSNAGHELLTVDDYRPRDISLYGHTHTFASLGGKPSTLSGYGITDGLNSLTVSGGGNAITSASLSGHILTLTKGATFQSKVAAMGSTTEPVYVSSTGTFAACSTYAGGTQVTLNGESKAASTASFYAPMTAGSSGQYLSTNGTQVTWQSQGRIASNNGAFVSGGAIFNYALQKTARGNSGTPVFVNTSGQTEAINYLNIGTEAGSIILPFFSNDLAFLQSRGGTCTITGATNTPELANMFNGKPDYTFITVSSVSSSVVITIELPTDRVYNYSQRLYIDFGAPNWAARSISVAYYQRPNTSTSTGDDTYKGTLTKDNDELYCFWVGGLFPLDEGYGLARLVITLTDFNATNPRISEIGIQHFNSEGMAAAYMSRGVDDKVWRSITPATTNTYNLGDSSHLWNNIYVRYARFNNLYSGDIYAKDNASTLSLYTGSSSKTFEFGTSINYSYRTLAPSVNNARDLGSSSLQWQYLYISGGLKIQNLNVVNYNQSTWGDGNVHTTLLIGNGFTGANNHTSIYGQNIDFYPTNSGLRFRVNDASIQAFINLRPGTDNGVDLGSSSYMWKDLFVKSLRPTTNTANGYPNLTYDTSNSRWVLTGNIYISGNMIAAGAVVSGATSNGSSSFPVAVGGSITPNAGSNYDLGSSDYKWRTVYADYIGDEDYRGDAYLHNLNVSGSLSAANLSISGIFSEPILTITESISSYLNGDSGTTSSSLNIASLYSNISNIVNGKYRKLSIGQYTLQITGYRNYNGQYSVYAGRYWFEQVSAASNNWYIHRL